MDAPFVIGTIIGKAASWNLLQRNQSGTASTAFQRWNNIGNILIIGVTKATAAISTPTDTAGNTYIDSGAGEIASGGTGVIRIFYVANCKAFAGVNTVTSTGADGVHVTEWSGAKLVNPVNVTVTTANAVSGAGTDNMTAGPLTTTVSGCLIFVYIGNVSGTISMGVGWSSPQGATDQPNGYFQYWIQPSAGAKTIKATDSSTGDNYGIIACAFKNKNS